MYLNTKKTLTLLIVMVSICLCASPLFAKSIGIQLGYQQGTGEAEIWDDDTYSEYPEQDLWYFSIGGIIDLPLGSDGYLHNRFMLLYQAGTVYIYESDSYWSRDLDFSRFGIMNTLALEISKKEESRLWWGPQLGLFIANGSDDVDLDYSGYAWALGFLLGYDFNINDDSLLSFEGGLRYGGMYLESDSSLDLGVYAYGFEIFIAASILFDM